MATNTTTTTELANAAVNFVPVAEETTQAATHSFLSLAPTLSASYPSNPTTSTGSAGQAEEIKKILGEADDEVLKANAEKTRRSSSLSSEGSVTGSGIGRRFLRLGPVHGGVSGGGDWSEEVLV
jgi:hypothetical protein